MKTRTFVAGALAITVALWCAFLYTSSALIRSRIVNRDAFETFTSPDGQYRLEYAVSSQGFKWMRLYRRGDNEVIADRRFWDDPPYRINWYEDSVDVAESDESVIYLPPHWWERWTAKLP